ncbi:MAG: TonB family protein [Desulfovibrio sp.]|nr:TonB family protein [Desulfovibrio sp.]
MKYSSFAAVIVLFGALAAFSVCEASSVMAVGQDEGYSGKVLDKIVAKWSPPPQLKSEYRLKLRIGLDGRGCVLECKATRSSGLQALDASACAAVKAAAPFGDPPYGMPADIYLSFWTGGPEGRTPEDAAKPAPFIDDSADVRARIASADAKARAEKVAKSTGKPLPSASEKKDAATKNAVAAKTGAKKPDQSTEHNVKRAVSPAPAKATPKEHVTEKTPPEASKGAGTDKTAAKEAPKEPVADKKVAKETPKPAAKPDLAQDSHDANCYSYGQKPARVLRNAMYVPAQTKPGTYYATAQVNFDKTGKIQSCSIIKGSGDALLDKYVLQGIKRAKRVPVPPPGIGDYLDLTFTLVRQ